MNYPERGQLPPQLHDAGPRRTRSRGTAWLWISLVGAAVIIVVLSAVVVAQFKNDGAGSSSPTAATASPTVESAPQPVPGGPGQPAAAASMTCDGYSASVDEGSQPGWHATVNRFGLAYAAPPDWTVAACGVRSGWAKPCPEGQCVIRELGAVSTIANPACPKQNLAMAGVTGSKNPDIHAALDEEAKTVSAIYTQNGRVPHVDFGPVREFMIGGHPAVQMVATVTDMAADACNGANAFHSMVVTTVPRVEGSVVFLISLREGATASPKPDVIDKIVETLRSPA